MAKINISHFFQDSHISLLTVLAICIVLLATGCEEKPIKAGIEILPEGDIIHIDHTDTITINAYTRETKRIISSDEASTPFGSYEDPLFGNVKAEYVAQFRPSVRNYERGPNPVADSAYILIGYSRYYGDTTNLPDFSIYEVTGEILDTSYYSDTDPIIEFGISAEDIIFGDPVREYSSADTLYRGIRVNISNEFANKLIQAEDVWVGDTAWQDIYYADFKYFKEKFPGLYFNINAENGGLYYLNTISVPFMQVYFHNDTSPDLSMTYLSYPKNYTYVGEPGDTRINLFSHDFSTSDFDNILKDTTNTIYDKLYLQPLAGTHANVTLPYLDALKEELGNILINEAILSVEVFDDVTQSRYPIPVKLGLRAINEEGNEMVMPEDFKTGSTINSFLGGVYISNDNAYTLNLGGYLQAYWNGEIENRGFNLFIAPYNYTPAIYNAIEANRLVLKNEFTLKLSYTLIP